MLLLAVGRISPEKRFDVLLAAFDGLRRRLPCARLVVVGDGSGREQLESSAPPGVHFVGEVRGEPLAELFASADLFCFPSTTDTFGQVLIEAGASGLPVVAAAAGGAPEIVRHGRSGLLVPPDDPEALADALAELATDEELRRKLGRRGAARSARPDVGPLVHRAASRISRGARRPGAAAATAGGPVRPLRELRKREARVPRASLASRVARPSQWGDAGRVIS